jgi:hypothetical protein
VAKTRTTLTVDADVLRAVRIKAARTGKRASEVIEESLRRDLGLDELDRLWAKVRPISEEEAMALRCTRCGKNSVRRAVLDTNVFVSTLIVPTGTSQSSGRMRAGRGAGDDRLTPLTGGVGGCAGEEKFRRYLDLDAETDFIDLLRREATVAPDPGGSPPMRSADPADDYQSARLVSGDSDLLDLADRAPICSPADLLDAAPA